MMDRIKKLPWLLIAQWSVIGALSGSAVADSVTDHGIQMAINCFSLGIVVMSMIGSKLVSLMAARLRFQDAVLNSLAAEFGRALHEGRIEVVSIDRAPDDRNHTTLH